MTSLAGLTLLECGATADDPAVRKAAKFVRQQAVKLHHTYSLATTILFLDKLGCEQDVRLLQALGARLLAGQNVHGGWGPFCPGPTARETKRLKKLQKEKQAEGPAMEGPRLLPEDVADELEALQKQARALLQPGDTTNTAWATLGLEALRPGSTLDVRIE